MEQHFTQSNEPIGLMVTTSFMTRQDITRLGTCSKLYHEMVAQNSLAWENTKLKNIHLTVDSLPSTLAARGAVVELFIHANLIRRSVQFMCELPRLNWVKIIKSSTRQVVAKPLSVSIESITTIDGLTFQKIFENFMECLPSTVQILEFYVDVGCLKKNSINLPLNINTLINVRLDSFTHNNNVKTIFQLNKPIGTESLMKFPSLKRIVTSNVQFNNRYMFPNSLVTFFSYHDEIHNTAIWPWPENIATNVRTIILVTASTLQILRLLMFDENNIVYSKLENLMIVINRRYQLHNAQIILKKILQSTTPNMPLLKNLVIFYKLDEELKQLSTTKISTSVTGCKTLIGPVPHNLNIRDIPQMLHYFP